MAQANPGKSSKRATVIAVSWVFIVGVGMTMANVFHASIGERLDRAVQIVAWVSVCVAVIVMGVILISTWSYGCIALLRATREDAVILRSGAARTLKAELDEAADIRHMLTQLRPLGPFFVLLVDQSGIEIWHGSGKGRLVGCLPADSIVQISTGSATEGAKKLNTIAFAVRHDGMELVLPFVVRSAGGLFGAKSTEVEAARLKMVHVLNR